jgi:hypothetical protein
MAHSETNILPDAKMREESIFLKDHTDMPLLGWDEDSRRRHDLTGQEDGPFGDRFEASDGAQDRRLAAT